MQISERLAVGVHILVALDVFAGKRKITGDFLAGSVGVNPVVIRRTLGQLRSSGLARVARGGGGASLARDPETITLLDISRALGCTGEGEGDLFRFHGNPNPACPVGRNIRAALGGRLAAVQDAMEREMARVTIADVAKDVRARAAAQEGRAP